MVPHDASQRRTDQEFPPPPTRHEGIDDDNDINVEDEYLYDNDLDDGLYQIPNVKMKQTFSSDGPPIHASPNTTTLTTVRQENGTHHTSTIESTSVNRPAPTTTTTTPTCRPSNECLLGMAFISFLTFAVTQLSFAVVAQSKALLGDSSAMMVDALMYLCNGLAERRKKRCLAASSSSSSSCDPENHSATTTRAAAAHARRKTLLQLEIVTPAISVTTLTIVCLWIAQRSIAALLVPPPLPANAPNVKVVAVFSCINLLLDIINICSFAQVFGIFHRRSRGATGLTAVEKTPISDDTPEDGCCLHEEERCVDSTGIDDCEEPHVIASSLPTLAADTDPQDNQVGVVQCECDQPTGSEDVNNITKTSTIQQLLQHQHHHHHEQEHNGGGRNLNMCSAYSHIVADTLRSVAVMLAAVVVLLFDRDAVTADSVAALVVCGLTLLTLVPLTQGIGRNIRKLRAMAAEEHCMCDESSLPPM